MKLTTKSYGSENGWSLGSCQSDGGYESYNEYTQQCCVTPCSYNSECPCNYNLECKDSYGDGWHGGYIEIDGIKYCENFSSGSEDIMGITLEDGGKFFRFFINFSIIILPLFLSRTEIFTLI